MNYLNSLLKCSILFVIALFLIITGCSKDKDNPSAPILDNFLWIHIAGDSTKVEFTTLPKIDADGEEAIQLSEFISLELIPMFVDKNGNQYDSRTLYSYQITADDGFSASVKGYPNNTWEQLQLGHILTADRKVVFPDDKIDLAGAYNVKESRHIYVYRKFDVITPDTTAFVEVRNFSTTPIQNEDGVMEEAILLSDCVTPFLSEPANYKYNLRTIDDFGPSTDMTWTEFETGYWLTSSEKSLFTDPNLNTGKYKLKVLEKIMVTQ